MVARLEGARVLLSNVRLPFTILFTGLGVWGAVQHHRRDRTTFWYFLALLSVNLAFVNLLPIPVLDGGHLLFLLIEKVKGSPVSTKVFGYSQVIGLVFVLLLVLFVTYNDILRLL